jgi:hypothetical protein
MEDTVMDFVAVMKLLFLPQEGISIIMCGHIVSRLDHPPPMLEVHLVSIS